MKSARGSAVVLVLVLILLLAAGSVTAADGGNVQNALTQLGTGIQHAGFSANASALQGAVTHLGHVINCIEGAGGEHFNAGWGHPCNNQGNGILSDVGDSPAALVVQAAHDLALQGVASNDLATVQLIAKSVGALLQAASDFLNAGAM